jgi:lysophospholipase L1-like esterase
MTAKGWATYTGSLGIEMLTTPGDRRVLFSGDSLVAGVGDPTGLGWVGRVVAASYAAGLPLTAYNLGVRGETSEQVSGRWRSEVERRLAASAEMLAVVSLGANDTTVQAGRVRVEPDRSRLSLSSILWEAGSLGVRSLAVGPAPVDDDDQNERIASLSASFANVCANAGVPFVAVFEPLLASRVWMQEISAADGAHPQSKGYETLAQLVIAAGWTDWLTEAERDGETA